MKGAQQKIKPIQIVLAAIMFVASGLFFVYKDKIIPNPNAEYKTHAQTFQKTEGTIIALDVAQGRRSSATEYTIQFRDRNDQLITVKMRQWTTIPFEKGKKVILYYNPQSPQEAIDEQHYKEIMR